MKWNLFGKIIITILSFAISGFIGYFSYLYCLDFLDSIYSMPIAIFSGICSCSFFYQLLNILPVVSHYHDSHESTLGAASLFSKIALSASISFFLLLIAFSIYQINIFFQSLQLVSTKLASILLFAANSLLVLFVAYKILYLMYYALNLYLYNENVIPLDTSCSDYLAPATVLIFYLIKIYNSLYVLFPVMLATPGLVTLLPIIWFTFSIFIAYQSSSIFLYAYRYYCCTKHPEAIFSQYGNRITRIPDKKPWIIKGLFCIINSIGCCLFRKTERLPSLDSSNSSSDSSSSYFDITERTNS